MKKPKKLQNNKPNIYSYYFNIKNTLDYRVTVRSVQAYCLTFVEKVWQV